MLTRTAIGIFWSDSHVDRYKNICCRREPSPSVILRNRIERDRTIIDRRGWRNVITSRNNDRQRTKSRERERLNKWLRIWHICRESFFEIYRSNNWSMMMMMMGLINAQERIALDELDWMKRELISKSKQQWLSKNKKRKTKLDSCRFTIRLSPDIENLTWKKNKSSEVQRI